jgi:hypothetical protein
VTPYEQGYHAFMKVAGLVSQVVSDPSALERGAMGAALHGGLARESGRDAFMQGLKGEETNMDMYMNTIGTGGGLGALGMVGQMAPKGRANMASALGMGALAAGFTGLHGAGLAKGIGERLG